MSLPTPAWAGFATKILKRLDETWNIHSVDLIRSVILEVPAVLPGVAPSALAKSKAARAQAQTTVDVLNDPPLPAHILQLQLRLAATFGSAEAVDRCLQPGAITILTGIPSNQVIDVRELFRLGFAPEHTRIGCLPRHLSECDVMLLASDDDFTQVDIASFHKRIRAVLGNPVPLIILCADGSELPADILRYMPPARQLTPFNREVLVQYLQITHRDATDTASKLAAQLPDDRALASLPVSAQQIALRAASAQGVVEQLRKFIAELPEKSGPQLSDMRGGGEALAVAKCLVADLTLWRSGELPWTDLCRSLLLHGVPGTGKTYLARAMGNSAGIGFVTASFAEWQSRGHLGDMLRAMQMSFAEARRQAPAILFIDEIDAIGARGGNDRNSDYRHQVVNAFLQAMDGISREEGVVVVGACNDPSRIDAAVLRAGRFDVQVELPLPCADTIFGILEPLRTVIAEEELRSLAQAAVGNTAAAVDGAIRTARTRSRAQGIPLALPQLRNLLLNESPAAQKLDHLLAVHECGHAIVGHTLGYEILRVMLSAAGGTTDQVAPRTGGRREDIEAQLTMALAGRAAERLVFGQVCAGSGGPEQSDLARATSLAVSIDTRFGLGSLGPVWTDTPLDVLMRDAKARQRVRVRLEAAEERASQILQDKRDKLEEMAAALVRKRDLQGEALREWMVAPPLQV